MKVLGVNHIAIADDQTGSLKKILSILNLHQTHSEIVEDQKVQTSFFKLGSPNFSIELLKPTEQDSVIQKYLDSKGPGIHHFCIQVDDVEQASKLLSDAGIRLIYPAPRAGAHHAKINFIHPKDAGGILIEIAQYS